MSQENRSKLFHFLRPKISNVSDIEDIIQETQNQNLWRLARNLKANQYEALWLRYVEDLSLKEIARIMRKSYTAARLLLHRARLNLGKQLQKNPEVSQIIFHPNPERQNMFYRENRG